MSAMSAREADVRPCHACLMEPLEQRLLLSGDVVLGIEEAFQAGWLAAPPAGYTYAEPDIPPPNGTQKVLYSVPEYLWHHGCGPTSAAMVLGYWDTLAYPNYFPGDASTQTVAVNEAIASKGDGSDTTADPGTPGTGHVPDYAYYDGINDYGWDPPHPDMSDVNPAGAHADDCIADFMLASQSAHDSAHGSAWSDRVDDSFIGYSDFVGYSAAHAVYETYSGGLSFNDMKGEIDAGRPMVFLVDTDGNNKTDHFVPIIGYRTDPQQYACYTTWDVDPAIQWHDWQGKAHGNNWGIHSGTYFYPCSGSADLAGSYFNVLNEPLQWGDSFDVSYRVKNYGTVGAGVSVVAFYLSSNATISKTMDISLGTQVILSVGAGATHAGSVSLSLPAEPPGGYTETDQVWIGMVVDNGGSVFEGVEGNNSNLGEFKDSDGVRIDGRPDLYGTNFEVDMNILNFGHADTDFTVHNGGATDAGTFVVEFYLSENPTITILDDFLDARTISGLSAGANYNGTIDLIVPTIDPFDGDGTYYVGMVIDRYTAVDEADEDNNASEGLGLDYDVGNYGVAIFHADFEHGDGGMEIDNKPGGGAEPGLWHITTHRGGDTGHTGTHSMYYGQEKVWNYDAGHTAGAFLTKRIQLPDEPVALTLNYLSETEVSTLKDIFAVQVYDVAGGTYHILLKKGTELSYSTGGKWKSVTADLTEYAGKEIRLRFAFDTIDASSNKYEGVYFDDIALWAANNPISVEAFRNLKYDSDLYMDFQMHFVGDHDKLVFNEEQTGGTLTIQTEDNDSAVNGAMAVYDYSTGEMLYIDDATGPGDEASVVLTNSGRWNSYLVEIWDTEENSTGDLDVWINGNYSFSPWDITLDDDGDGQKTGQIIDPDTDTDFFRATAPPQASGTLDIDLHVTGGTLIPRLQVWKYDGDDVPELVTTLGSGQITGVAPGDRFDISISENNFVGTGDFDLLVDFSTSVPGTLTTAEGFCYFHNDGVSRDTHASASYISADDVDSFYFAGDFQWTGNYTIRVDALTGTVDPVVAVYDATSGDQLGFDDDSGGGTSAELTLSLAEFTRYVVAVADDNRTDTGTVAITITAPQGTGPSYIGIDANGNGQRVGLDNIQDNDTDFFSFASPADANGELEVTVSPEASLDAAAVLFDAAGNELGRAYVAGAGDDELITVTGLSPSTTYYLTVLARNYATTGDYDVYVNFEQIVPEELPDAPRMVQVPNLSGDGTRVWPGPDDWYGWVFGSDRMSSGATLTVTSTGDRVPVLGLYDRATGQRLAWDSNLGNSSTASITFDIASWTAYELITKPKSGTTGDLEVTINLDSPGYAGAPAIDLDGQGTASGTLDDPADIDYYRLVAPVTATGELSVTMHSPGTNVEGTLELFDNATGAWLDDAYTYTPGGDVVLTYAGVEPGGVYDLAVYTSWLESGSGAFDLEIDFAVALPGTMSSAVAEGWAYFDHDGTVHDSPNFDALIDFEADVDSYIFAGQEFWTGSYTITATAPMGSDVNPVLAVYDGASGTRLGFATSAGGSTATLNLTLDELTEYVLAVADDRSDDMGDVEITIDSPGYYNAEVIALDPAGDGSDTDGDWLIDNDTNFYRFVAPDDTNGELNVRVVPRPTSTLAPAIALFDSSGTYLGSSSTSVAGAEISGDYSGLTPGETYYLSVMAYRHRASTGGYDVYVDFDLVVPDELPSLPTWVRALNTEGDRTYAASTPDGWWAWLFASDVSSDTAVFSVTSDGDRVPVLGLYDMDTGERLAWDSNLDNDDTATFTFDDIANWTRYQLVAGPKSGTTGVLTTTVDVAPQPYAAVPTIDPDGQGSASGGMQDAADIDYYKLVAPDTANGELTLTLYDVDSSVRGVLELFDNATGNSIGYAAAPGAGDDVVLTYTGVEPSGVYDLAIRTWFFNIGTGDYTLDIDFGVVVPSTIDPADADYNWYPNVMGDQTFNGNFTAGSPGPKIWAIRPEDDGTVVLDMTSDAFETVLGLYDASGNVLAWDSAGVGAHAHVEHDNVGATRYYVYSGADPADAIGSYVLDVDVPDFSLVWTIPIDPGTGGGSFDPSFITPAPDQDFFRITAPINAKSLTLTMHPKDPALHPRLRLYDNAGDLLGMDVPLLPGKDAIVAYPAVTGGARYFAGTGSLIRTGGEFAVYANFVLYDVPLTAPLEYHAALNVSGDREILTSLDPAADRDSWRIVSDAGGRTGFAVSAAAGINPLLALYDGKGDLVLVDDSSSGTTESMAYSLTANEVYTILVQDAERDDTGKFALSIGAPVASSTSIPLNAAGKGSAFDLLDFGTQPELADCDYFDFTVPADGLGRLDLSVAPLAAYRIEFQLFDPSGAPVGASQASPSDGAPAERTFLGLSPGKTYHVCVFPQGFDDHPAGGKYEITVDCQRPLQVVGTSPADGEIVPPGDVTIALTFNEQIDDSTLDQSDFLLTGMSSGNQTADAWHYSATSSTLTIEYSSLATDVYDFVLYDTVTDEHGAALDGDADGTPGGDFEMKLLTTYPGDTDLDGDVDFVDYITTKGNFGMMSGATWGDGDSDGDGDVDFTDYIATKGNFGKSIVSGGVEVLGAAAAPAVAAASSAPAVSGATLATPAAPSDGAAGVGPSYEAAALSDVLAQPSGQRTVAEADLVDAEPGLPAGASAAVGAEADRLDVLSLAELLSLPL